MDAPVEKTLPAAGIRLELASMEIQPFRFVQVCPVGEFYQHRIRSSLELVAFLKKNRTAMHLINHAFDYVELAHQINARLLTQCQIVGICHTDQDYYYENLAKIDPHLAGIIAVSPTCLRRLEKQSPHRIGSIPVLPDWDMPIPLPRAPSAFPARPLRLLFNGRLLHLQKRVLDIPPFLAALAKRRIPLELTIAGDGPDLPKLKTALDPLPSKTAVRFTGSLPPWKMDSLLDEHDIFLQLSEFEGASVSLMEGMLHSLAPVVTRIDSGIDLLQTGRNALLAPVGDSEALAGHVALLHRDRTQLAPLAQAAYQTAAAHLRQLNYPVRLAHYLQGLKKEGCVIFPASTCRRSKV